MVSKVAQKGHNRVGGVAVEQLESIIERWEKLQEEKKAIAADQREVMAEAKGNGFDTKAIREIIKQRAMDAAEREEFQNIVEVYARALGLLALE